MPKNLNEKKEAARVKEAEKKSAASSKAAKDAEDAFWQAAGEGEKGRGAARKEEEERKRLEQAAKKAELKRLQEEEEAKLSASKAKATPGGLQKMTKYQLDRQREIEEGLRAEELREKALAARRELDPEAYDKLVAAGGTNKAEEGVIDARSVEGALSALGVADTPDEKHPEKRMRAAYKAFEESTLAQLKQEKPGLKMSQYKDMIWKLWLKSPQNPMVQAGRV